jgi:hypothetical protein
MRHNEFTIDNLIKGKIAEIIFEEMFSEIGCKVIPFGYERTVPELRRYNKSKQGKKVLNNFRDTPDFAVIPSDKKNIFLIEVKFRSKLDMNEIIETARRQMDQWDRSELIIATKEGFYINECATIINNNDNARLDYCRVREELQNKYLKLIQKFEK